MSTSLFGIVYNGVTIDRNQSVFTINHMEGMDGIPIRISEDDLTGYDGGNIWNRLYSMRTIAFEGSILTPTHATYFAAKAVLDTMFSRFAATPLLITRWDGVTRLIQAKVTVPPMIVEDSGKTDYCDWRVELKCEDPFFTDVSDTAYNLTLAQGGGIPIPTPIPLQIQSGQGDTVLITNGGVEAYPEVYIYGPVVNPTITNLTTGLSFQINTTILDGHFVHLKFDTTGIYVKLDDLSNYYQYFIGTFFKLATGNNTLKFTAGTYNTTARAVVNFKNHYINL